LVFLESSMHHVHFHDRVGVTNTASHGAHMFAVNQHGHAQWLDDLLNETSNQMGGPFLILQSSRKMPCNARELGQSQYFFIGNIADGDVHENRQQMMLAQADFLIPSTITMSWQTAALHSALNIFVS